MLHWEISISLTTFLSQFNRFDRPDLRKNLFNKFLKSRPGLKKPGDGADNGAEEEEEEEYVEQDGKE